MRYRYTRYVGEDLEGVDLGDLVSQLADLLLASGFDDPHGLASEDESRTIDALRDAIRDALLEGGLLSDEAIDRLFGDAADADHTEEGSGLERLVQALIDRLEQEGYITRHPEPGGDGDGQGSKRPHQARFEITDKSLDFLGFRTLRDLLGSVGTSSVGRHDTRMLATGIEAGGAPKPYEFGDTLNLDASATIMNAVRRAGIDGARGGIDVRYDDLMVAQGEYHSSCATVLLLDCSHSMILYGEDRFTPAKRVALALMNLIRSQYPGDAMHLVLFHDSAEEIPSSQLARVRVGPYHTNTREGLRLARRILERQRKDMRQIIMITDGKPSAITRPDGQIYKNAFGLDPYIVAETFAEVAACRKSGIMINTFMLARDYELVAFVQRMTEICRGKAYFTTPYTLGRYVLMDYMDKKTRIVH